jgi:hypothetical protein
MAEDFGHDSLARADGPDSVNHRNWNVGQKVRCIKSGYLNIELPDHPAQKFQIHNKLKVGEIYTIRALNMRGPHNPGLIGSGCGFLLEEVKNPKWPSTDAPDGWLEISYDQIGFEAVS